MTAFLATASLRCDSPEGDSETGSGGDGEGACCRNVCEDSSFNTLAGNGICEDGGPGSINESEGALSLCPLGADCADCGPRETDSVYGFPCELYCEQVPGPCLDDSDCCEGAVCGRRHDPERDQHCCIPDGGDAPTRTHCCSGVWDGSTCLGDDTGGTSDDSAGNGCCSNSCEYANDRTCDDGGPGSDFGVCDLGTDCADCGPRPAEDCGGPACEEEGGACSATDECCGAALCIDVYGNGEGGCVKTCEGDADCGDGCCRPTTGGDQVCAPTDVCDGTAGDTGSDTDGSCLPRGANCYNAGVFCCAGPGACSDYGTADYWCECVPSGVFNDLCYDHSYVGEANGPNIECCSGMCSLDECA